MTEQDKKTLLEGIQLMNKRIKGLEQERDSTIKDFIAFHSIFKVGEQIRIKYPNPIHPKYELEITKIDGGSYEETMTIEPIWIY